MKTISRLRYFIYLSILIVGCTTGKKALQNGNYDASLTKAVNRLQNSPNNAEARTVLVSAYRFSLQSHLRKIDEAKLSGEVLRWEAIGYEYQQINWLSNEINNCPSCLTLIPNPQKFVAELAESNYKAAEARYNLGINLLNENNRISAKKAFDNFERAQRLIPDYKDVQEKINEAYRAAVLKVVVEPIRINNNPYKLSTSYFQQEIEELLSSYQQPKFVIFYTKRQAVEQNMVPDQVIHLSFDDFIIGQTYVKERVEKLKMDSVKIGETRAKEPVYGTVKATLSIFDKKIASSGLLNLTVTDWNSRKVINRKKLDGTYIWQDQWATYKGDERALTRQQVAMSKKKEILPPDPHALFVGLTRPIYSRLVAEISSFYKDY
ncbi:MAG: hypothetical protein V4541_06280 [Bacteroidota bacterium]